MDNKQNDLEVLFPVNTDVIGGERINLRPFVFGKWTEVLKLSSSFINTFLDALNANDENVLDVEVEEDGFKASPKLFELVQTIISEGGDNVYEILAISARKPRSWVDELEGEDGLKLLIGTIAVNKDFFIKKVGPMLTMLQSTTKKAPPGGK